MLGSSYAVTVFGLKPSASERALTFKKLCIWYYLNYDKIVFKPF